MVRRAGSGDSRKDVLNVTKKNKAALVITTAAALATWAASPAFGATGWVLQTTPNPAGVTLAELNAVSCTSASFCIAVGDAETSSGALTVVAERWNGSTWTTQTIPGGGKSAVSCTSSSNCEAVGGESAEVWNGSTWTAQTISTPAQSGFTSVSCSSASNCTAVGTTFIPSTGVFRGLAERWNGSTWSVQTFSQPGLDTEPFGVSCGSATSCEAVGYYETRTATIPLAESWNGSTWTLQTTPNPSGAEVSSLQGISCPTTTDCTAAGYSYVTNPDDRTLAEQWTG